MIIVRYEVPTEVLLVAIQVFWVMPCQLINIDWCFEGTTILWIGAVYQSKWHDSPEDLNSLHHYNYYELSYWFVTVHEDSSSNRTGIYETGLLHKRVLFLYLISVIYCAECALWNCDQTYVFNYSRLSELRTVLSSPPVWMGQFSQVWEYAVCYRCNCSSKYRRYCNINFSCFKKFHKQIWKKYIHIIHTQCTTPICPLPHFVLHHLSPFLILW